MKTKSIIYIGDNRKILPTLAPNSVHLIITSPPYWNLKDYGNENQIGYGQDYSDYIYSLFYVFEQCWDILHPGCKMVINIGDIFPNKNNGHTVSIQKNIIEGMCQQNFKYKSMIIWQKKRHMSASFLGSHYHPRDGVIKCEHEYILVFKKPGEPPAVNPIQKVNSRLSKEERLEFFNSVWEIQGKNRLNQKDHTAAFPLEIPLRLIKMFSYFGETVLDPFAGIGTTAIAAKKCGRSSIGIELNPAFIPQINNFDEVKYEN